MVDWAIGIDLGTTHSAMAELALSALRSGPAVVGIQAARFEGYAGSERAFAVISLLRARVGRSTRPALGCRAAFCDRRLCSRARRGVADARRLERQELAVSSEHRQARGGFCRLVLRRTSKRSLRSKPRSVTWSTSSEAWSRAARRGRRCRSALRTSSHGAGLVRRRGARAHGRGGVRRRPRERATARGAAGRALCVDRSSRRSLARKLGPATWSWSSTSAAARPTSLRSRRSSGRAVSSFIASPSAITSCSAATTWTWPSPTRSSAEARGRRARARSAGRWPRLAHACRAAKETAALRTPQATALRSWCRAAGRSCSAERFAPSSARRGRAGAARRLLPRRRRRGAACGARAFGAHAARAAVCRRPGHHAAPRRVPRRQARRTRQRCRVRAEARGAAPPHGRALQRRRGQGRRAREPG